MTLEELKAEANKLGYGLCGKKSTSVWYGQRGIGTKRQCSFCYFDGDWTNDKISTTEAWNNAVERYLKEHEEVK